MFHLRRLGAKNTLSISADPLELGVLETIEGRYESWHDEYDITFHHKYKTDAANTPKPRKRNDGQNRNAPTNAPTTQTPKRGSQTTKNKRDRPHKPRTHDRTKTEDEKRPPAAPKGDESDVREKLPGRLAP